MLAAQRRTWSPEKAPTKLSIGPKSQVGRVSADLEVRVSPQNVLMMPGRQRGGRQQAGGVSRRLSRACTHSELHACLRAAPTCIRAPEVSAATPKRPCAQPHVQVGEQVGHGACNRAWARM